VNLYLEIPSYLHYSGVTSFNATTLRNERIAGTIKTADALVLLGKVKLGTALKFQMI
jgi:hypothetical protein